jgi:hypothetical protein
MKTLLTMMLVLASMITSAQTVNLTVQSQIIENGVTKILVKNEYNCSVASDKTSFTSTSFPTKTPVSPYNITWATGESKWITVGTTEAFILYIKHENNNTCYGTPGQGEFQISVNKLEVLPIKWVQQPKTRWLDERTLEVTYAIGEAVNVKQFNFEISTDGRNFRRVDVQLPDSIQPNKLYTKLIRF